MIRCHVCEAPLIYEIERHVKACEAILVGLAIPPEYRTVHIPIKRKVMCAWCGNNPLSRNGCINCGGKGFIEV